MKNDSTSIKITRRNPIALYLSALVIGLTFMLAGCDTQPTEIDDYQPQPMLTAFLYNGEPINDVIVEKVGSLYGHYNPSNYGITNAEVKIFPVGNTNAGDTLFFEADTSMGNVGHYHPVTGDSLIPQGQVTYRVEARVPSENIYLWALTTIPDTFSVTSINYPVISDTLDTTLTREATPIQLTWNPSFPIGGYILPVTCLDTNYIPLDPNFDPDEDKIPEDSSRWSFNLVLPEYNQMSIPWIMFSYEGWYEMELQAAAPDYFEYYFSIFRTWQGAMTSLQYNVNGGLGIVAGMARHRYYLRVVRVP
jgi:hypothetical protein